MPFTDPTDTVIAELTDKGHSLDAEAHLGLVGYAFVGFAVGREGYDDANPVLVDAITTADTELGDRIYPVGAGTYKAFALVETVPPGVAAPIARLETTEANYGLGELGVWVIITFNAVNPGDVGNTYLYALAHFPLKGKTDKDTFVWRIIFTK